MLAELMPTLDLSPESGTILRHTLNTAEQYFGNGRKFLTTISNNILLNLSYFHENDKAKTLANPKVIVTANILYIH